MNDKYTKMMNVAMIKYQDKAYNKSNLIECDCTQ